jgi:hypothetical protein
MTKTKLITQTEFANLIGKTRSWVSNYCRRNDCPFDFELVGKKPVIRMTSKTDAFIKSQKKQ